MRVACLQLSPVHGDIAASQARADILLASATPGFADLLLLPELAFSGYTFGSSEAVLPLAEEAGGAGPVASWCRATAARLLCTVVCGYIEQQASVGRLYNSQLVVDRNGELLGHHRKAHLYATDERWSSEGAGWSPVFLCAGRRCFLGICMDLNPYKFKAPWLAHEWARAAMDAQADVLCFSSAWCDRSPEDPPGYVPPPVDANNTWAYWASRLLPLVEGERAVHFLAADRVGKEGLTTFCGSSCVMRLGGGEIELLAGLGAAEESMLLTELL